MPAFSLLLLISIVVLGIIIISEMVAPGLINEGFVSMQTLPKESYWSTFISPRNDITPVQEEEDFIRDPRYFNGYTDVSRIGQNYDFCRMIAPKDDPTNKFFACALAGTDNLDSTIFRTKGTRDGFELSYDDYMRDINNDGRADYCRILKWNDSTWLPVCVKPNYTQFEDRDIIDGDPPEDIQRLLTFYQGCVVWLRFFNNMEDSVKSVKVMTSGDIRIDETVLRVSQDATAGLQFNGSNQFLRLTDGSDMSLGSIVPLRSIRSIMVWAKFDSFTNNAKIFDFGNGKGMDNVFLGIIGRGDASIDAGDELRGSPTKPVMEMSPQRLMETTSANVNEWVCTDFETEPRKLPHSTLPNNKDMKATSATLIYEIWDKQQRKMRISVVGVIPVNKWIHICIAATNNDAFRPNLSVYIDGRRVLEKESGFLPSTSNMTNCYIGKSNWANAVSQYEDRDEAFHGSLFDFRMYQGMIPEAMIKDSYKWGKKQLALP